MELRQLTYFLEICRDLSISKAAKNLYVTQQAVSKAIGNLEGELEVELFFRSPAGLNLTPYGQYLEEKARIIMSEINNTTEEIRRRRDAVQAKISLGLTYGVLSALPAGWLSDFRNAHPHISLSVQEYPDKICERLLEEKVLDTACVVAPVDGNRYQAERLFSEPLYLVISTENPLAKKTEPLTMDDIRDQSFLQVSDDFNAPEQFHRVCEEAGFHPRVIFSSPETFFLQEMVRQNRGLYLVPEHMVALGSHGDVVFRPFPDFRLSWDILLISRKNEFLSDPAKEICDYLLAITDEKLPLS